MYYPIKNSVLVRLLSIQPEIEITSVLRPKLGRQILKCLAIGSKHMLRTTSMASVSRILSCSIGKKGQLNLAGINAGSKAAAEELLLRDAEQYHCFFRSAGLHNHLSHQSVLSNGITIIPETGLTRPLRWKQPPCCLRPRCPCRASQEDRCKGLEDPETYLSRRR